MNRSLKNQARLLRRGITLLEVLISMFVALVGLAGLASLFWLGGIEMSEGVKYDRALAVGRAAQRTFKILGMHRPIQAYSYVSGGVTTTGLMQTWVFPSSNSPTLAQFIDSSIPGGTVTATSTTPVGMAIAPAMPFAGAPPNYLNNSGNGGGFFGIAINTYTQGFAIDPIGVFANGEGYPAFPAWNASGAVINFPQDTSNPLAPFPCLIRITLMAYPQAFPAGQTTPWLVTAAHQTGQTYTAGQADLVFRSQDDLILNPPNGDYPPTQFYSTAGRRQSQGDYSWLATVVPSFSSYQSNVTNPKLPIDTPIGDANLVRVSIVVFYKRNPVVHLNDPTSDTPPPERMVAVNTTPIAPAVAPTGIAGGDVQLTTSLDLSMNQNNLNLKPGQWIMLSQAPVQLQYNASASIPPTPAKTSPPPPLATTVMFSTYWSRWYKVVAAGPIQGGPGNYYRNVTLSGPDWNPNPNPILATPPVTYASIFDGVVAVFEREIELEQSGAPFSPN